MSHVLTCPIRYFFVSNNVVDGCANKKEPGYEHMEWLRVQLQFMRERNMKAILIGHVPPARTENKMSWDETCWQKYALWMQQYRDVLVGEIFGHMNINHFMFQDFHEIENDVRNGHAPLTVSTRKAMEDELSISSAANYLIDLRDAWANLPLAAVIRADQQGSSAWTVLSSIWRKKDNVRNMQKSEDDIGGHWAERYSVSHVGPSVVPNYFPTIRIFEYNTTGLEYDKLANTAYVHGHPAPLQSVIQPDGNSEDGVSAERGGKVNPDLRRKKQKFKVPDPPSKSTPPGPAYSPQTLTLLGYKQYFANLTSINNDTVILEPKQDLTDERWKRGKHHGKKPKKGHAKPHPEKFEFKLEYETKHDKVFKLKDLTVRSYLDLARRIGDYNAEQMDWSNVNEQDDSDDYDYEVDIENKKKHKKKKGKHGNKTHKRTKEWFTFVKRAFVETIDASDIEEQFGVVMDGEREEL
jgi:endopolyphosphatase